MQSRLPTRDEDIAQLIGQIIDGIRNGSISESHPPVPLDQLEADLVRYRELIVDYHKKKTAADQAAVAKNQLKLTNLAHIRQLRDWGCSLLGHDDPRLGQLGLAVSPKAGVPISSPILESVELYEETGTGSESA